MAYPDLLILRHGETEWNREGRIQGEMDSPLTDRGRAQAAAQGRLMADRDLSGWAMWSSPQRRARTTAEIALPGHHVLIDPRLSEIAMGEWTGARRAEIAQQHPHLFDHDTDLTWYDSAPGGEGLEALYARTGAFLATLRGPAVLVTHGITSRMLRCHALGLEPGAFADLPGGQGVVYAILQGKQICLSEGA